MVQRDPTYKGERNRKIYEERKAGLTFKEIGARYGIGAERVRQIYLREKRLAARRKYLRRFGTFKDIQDLETIRDRFELFAKWRAREITEEDKDLIQKINNLIEVYSE